MWVDSFRSQEMAQTFFGHLRLPDSCAFWVLVSFFFFFLVLYVAHITIDPGWLLSPFSLPTYSISLVIAPSVRAWIFITLYSLLYNNFVILESYLKRTLKYRVGSWTCIACVLSKKKKERKTQQTRNSEATGFVFARTEQRRGRFAALCCHMEFQVGDEPTVYKR